MKTIHFGIFFAFISLHIFGKCFIFARIISCFEKMCAMRIIITALKLFLLSFVLLSCSEKEEPFVEPVPVPTPVPTPEPAPQLEQPEIKSMTMDGYYAKIDKENSTLTFTLPTRTRFKEVTPWFYIAGQKVLWGDVDVTNGQTPLDLSEPITLTVVNDTLYKEYKVMAQNTGLPVVRIKTTGGQSITSKTVWMEGCSLTIENPDGTLDYEGTMSIRGRGNSTWNYPKKPYAIKLDAKSKILGMPKQKRWVLLANWKDRTLMRNDAAFWLSQQTDLDYTPRGQFVELELNGKHMGNYYLCEQIKIDKNRVNVVEMDPMETDPEKITGGFLLELDTYFDEVNKFKSPKFGLPYQFKQPDEEELSGEAKNYLENYVAELEDILVDEEKVRNHAYEAYLDVDSSIDFMFVFELTNNTEFYNSWPSVGPHSVYLHKDRGGLLCTGPVWDFDYTSFVPAFSTYWVGATRTMYYPALLKDEKYRARMIEKWEKEREALKKLPDYIDEMVRKLEVSEAINNSMWPINNSENGDEKMSFQQAIDRMKDTYKKRWEWVDRNIYLIDN